MATKTSIREFSLLAHLQLQDIRNDKTSVATKEDANLKTPSASGLVAHLTESAKNFQKLDANTQALISALWARDDDLALAAIKSGVNPNATSDGKEGSMTVLMIAALENCPRALESLIDSGADIDATDYQRWTSLHHAAFHPDGETFYLLLNSGADSSIQTLEGKLPMDFFTHDTSVKKPRTLH